MDKIKNDWKKSSSNRNKEEIISNLKNQRSRFVDNFIGPMNKMEE